MFFIYNFEYTSMSYVLYEDTVDADPLNIHKDACRWYTERDPNAKTSIWHDCYSLEYAHQLAEQLVKTKGCKHCDTCMDDAWVIDPQGI